MKGIITKALILVCGLSLSASVFANKQNDNMNNMKHMMWTCETNASSASTDADKKADDMMSKKGMSAKEAFGFAYKHCRDCTKITCSTSTSTSSTEKTDNT